MTLACYISFHLGRRVSSNSATPPTGERQTQEIRTQPTAPPVQKLSQQPSLTEQIQENAGPIATRAPSGLVEFVTNRSQLTEDGLDELVAAINGHFQKLFAEYYYVYIGSGNAIDALNEKSELHRTAGTGTL